MFSLLHGFGWLHETLAMARVELMLGHGGRSMLSYHDATVLVSERAALLLMYCNIDGPNRLPIRTE